MAVFVDLCRRLPTYWKIDMVVWRTDWVSSRKLCAGGGFTCSTRFAPAHGQRAVRADRCAATGATWFSGSALRHSHTYIGPGRTYDLWRDPRRFLRGKVIVTSDDYLLRMKLFLFEKREKATSDERRRD